MGRKDRRAVRRFTGSLTIVVFRAMGVLPLPLVRWAGRCLGLLAYFVYPRLRRTGLRNLERAYGSSLSPAERRRILRRAVQNLGIVAAEFPHLRRLAGSLLDNHVEICGLERLDLHRGFVGISGHMANWEWVPTALCEAGLRGAAVARPLDDVALDRYVEKVRQAGGARLLKKDGVSGDVVRHLRKGDCVGILVDQSPRENGVPVTFFGQSCWATAAPVLLAMRARVPIHPLGMWRKPDGNYRIEVGEALELQRSDDSLDDLQRNCQQCQDAIEAFVRREPGQWLWFHRRWKQRPRLESQWQARRSKRGK